MKRLAIVVVVLLVLIISGGLTAQVASNGGQVNFPGIIVATRNPDASVFEMTPWKAEQVFLLIGFLLFNLVGIALTLALLFWFLNWQVKRVKASEKPGAATTTPATVDRDTAVKAG